MNYILKINFAGSGDFVWRKVVHNNTIELATDLAEQFSDDNRKYLAEQLKDLVPRDQSILFRFEGKNIYVMLPNTVENMYGEGQMSLAGDGILTFWFKQDTSKLKITYTVPGVQGELFGMIGRGAADIGQYSIRKTVETLIPEITKRIDELLLSSDDADHIIVHIKGHSRGGVSANFVIKMLSTKYKSDEKVQICTTQFDPVPGPATIALTKTSDRLDPPPNPDIFPENYEEIYLDNIVKSAVIYSLKSDKLGMQEQFNIQKVHNAKVIVLMNENHAVGLYYTSEKKGKIVKRLYNLSIPGIGPVDYSPGKLFNLPEGIYWADNNNTTKRFVLTKIIFDNFDRYMKTIVQEATFYRKNFLISLIYEKVLTNAHIDRCFKANNIGLTLTNLKKLFHYDEEFSLLLENVEQYVTKPSKERPLLFFDKLKCTTTVRNYKIRIYVLDKFEKTFKI